MGEVTPLPTNGVVLFDQRDGGRSLRLSWHPELTTFVLSIWRDDVCTATFHLPLADVGVLMHSLTDVLTREVEGLPAVRSASGGAA